MVQFRVVVGDVDHRTGGGQRGQLSGPTHRVAVVGSRVHDVMGAPAYPARLDIYNPAGSFGLRQVFGWPERDCVPAVISEEAHRVEALGVEGRHRGTGV